MSSSIFGTNLEVTGALSSDTAVYSGGGLGFGYTEVAQASYSATGGEGTLGVTYTATGAVTITLPEISTLEPTAFRQLVIVDVGMNSSTNNITLTPGGSDTLVGITGSGLIDDDGAAVRLVSDGGTQWMVGG